MIIFYSLIIFSLAVYSFSLIDPNITFLQTRWWEVFRENLVYFGYYRRDLSWLIYLSLVLLLFIFHYYFIKKYKQFSPHKLAFIIGGILVVSYPFLSHDFFNYMFDARILTFYHQNPYLSTALDFPSDLWTRFMHWTHRTYPYGPVFLLITLVPSFLSLGKFVLSFLLFKFTFVLFYLLSVYLLHKIDRKNAVIFATHPLIIIEGLVNSHNDLIAVSLGIAGLFYLLKNNSLAARLLFLASAGIKFITFPILFLLNKKNFWNRLVITVTIFVIFYLSLSFEIQPWYFLNLFIFLALFKSLEFKQNLNVGKFDLFFAGLLLSYYPYIRLGGWDTNEKVEFKHSIIIFFTFLNLLYFFFLHKEVIFKRIGIKTK